AGESMRDLNTRRPDTLFQHTPATLDTAHMIESGAKLKDVVSHIARNDPDKELREVAKIVHRLLPDAVKLFRMKPELALSPNGGMRSAFYRPVSDEVHVETSLSGANVNRDVIHESIHALTSHAIEAKTPAGQEIVRLSQLYKKLAGPGRTYDNGSKATYGFASPHEFVAEFYSNPAFRDVLSAIHATEAADAAKPPSLFTRMMNAIKRVLGLPLRSEILNQILPRVKEMENPANVLGRAAAA